MKNRTASLAGRSVTAGLTATLAAVALALSGCSNAPESQSSPAALLKTGRDLLGGLTGSARNDQATVNAADIPARVETALASTSGPVALALFDRSGVMTSITPAQRNGDHVTWMSPEQRSFGFLNGIVVSTRGLGDDLMASEADAAAALITARGTGSAERTYYHLTGIGLTQSFRVTCSIAPGDADRVTMGDVDTAATIMVETCANGPFSKQNLYWVTRDGIVLKSYQWIGAALGHLTIVQLRR